MATWYKLDPSKRLRSFDGSALNYCVFAGLCDFAFEFGGLPDSTAETAALTGLPQAIVEEVWPAYTEACAKTSDGKLMPLDILQAIREQKLISKRRSEAGRQGGTKSGATRSAKVAEAIRAFQPVADATWSNQEAFASTENDDLVKPRSNEAIASRLDQEAIASHESENEAIASMSNGVSGLPQGTDVATRARALPSLIHKENNSLVREELKTSLKSNNSNIQKGEREAIASRSNQFGNGKAGRSADDPLPFVPLTAEPEDREDLHVVLAEVFPGDATDTRKLMRLMTLVLKLAATGDDVRRWPSWFAARFPNRAQTSMSFLDSFHQMLLEAKDWPTGMRFVMNVCFGVNAQQITSTDSLKQADLNKGRTFGRRLQAVVKLNDATEWQKRGFLPRAFVDFWQEKFPNAGSPTPESVVKYWPAFEDWLRSK